MKTILKNGEYLRVSEEVAEIQVRGGAKYVPKSEWKINVRDTKTEAAEEQEVKSKKTKSKKAEKRSQLKQKQRQ